MYKLYDWNTMTKLDENESEEAIIETLSEYMKEYLNVRFKIIFHSNVYNCDMPYKRINSVGDYYDYINEYQERQKELETQRLKQMSCLELKREMLELSDKPRCKIKKLK